MWYVFLFPTMWNRPWGSTRLGAQWDWFSRKSFEGVDLKLASVLPLDLMLLWSADRVDSRACAHFTHGSRLESTHGVSRVEDHDYQWVLCEYQKSVHAEYLRKPFVEVVRLAPYDTTISWQTEVVQNDLFFLEEYASATSSMTSSKVQSLWSKAHSKMLLQRNMFCRCWFVAGAMRNQARSTFSREHFVHLCTVYGGRRSHDVQYEERWRTWWEPSAALRATEYRRLTSQMKGQQPLQALRLVETMQHQGLTPDLIMYRAAISVFAKGKQSEQALCLSEAMQQKGRTQSYVSSRSRFIIITFFFSWIANTLSCTRRSKTQLFLSILHFSQRYYTIQCNNVRPTNNRELGVFVLFWMHSFLFSLCREVFFLLQSRRFRRLPRGSDVHDRIVPMAKTHIASFVQLFVGWFARSCKQWILGSCSVFWAILGATGRICFPHTVELSVRNLIFHMVRVWQNEVLHSRLTWSKPRFQIER